MFLFDPLIYSFRHRKPMERINQENADEPLENQTIITMNANIMHDTTLMTLITMMVIVMAVAMEKEMSRQTMKSKEGNFKRKAACTWQQWQW